MIPMRKFIYSPSHDATIRRLVRWMTLKYPDLTIEISYGKDLRILTEVNVPYRYSEEFEDKLGQLADIKDYSLVNKLKIFSKIGT